MRIAILTRLPSYYSQQRLSEEGKKRGHDVQIVNYQKCYVTLDGKKSEARYEGASLQDIDAVIPRLMTGTVSYGATITRQLEVAGVYTTVSSVAITRTFDRARAMQVLNRSGVPIPKTIVARDADQWGELLAHFELPVMIESVSSTKGSGPVLIESAKAATAVTRAIGGGTPFIMQERMGEDSVDIAAMVVGGRVVASVKHALVAAKTPSAATAVRVTADENKIILRAAKALGLTICSVQIIRSAQGTYVIGADATPSLELFEQTTKRNVAEKIIEYIELHAKRRNKKDRVGA